VTGSRAETSPEESPSRRFLTSWRGRSEPVRIWPVGILTASEDRYRFAYVLGVEDIPDFRPILGFPDWSRTYESKELFPFFAQRIMDARRHDYPEYLDSLALPASASALDVLARSGGRRKADEFQLVEVPRISADGTTSYVFRVHGVRFALGDEELALPILDRIGVGDELLLVLEPDNPVNPRAIVVATPDGVRLGWVPDLLVDYVEALRAGGEVRVRILRVNGPTVPPQDRLVVELYGRLEPSTDTYPRLRFRTHDTTVANAGSR
jgi:hypothetical protein